MRGFRRRWIAGLVMGAVLCTGPLFGFLGTMAGLSRSFEGVSGVDPSMKAQMLASGISTAMWSTAIGLALLPAGAILLGISLWRLFATRQAQPAN